MPNAPTGRREITLLQERSSGTFADVHLARATDSGGLNRIVAVKVLKERWIETSDVLDRTRDEAQLLASLQHQNILRVEAITEIDERPAIIMEFVHGVDLSQLLEAAQQRNMQIPFRAVYEIAEGIASALAAAWFKVPIGRSDPLRVVHRDIKPSNVMISTEGELRVLDFGTARFEDASRIAKTAAFRFGSLKYMSPERREGERGDHASDLYSLGLVIIELLNGRIAQPLPGEASAHEESLVRLVDSIPSFGLPNDGWDGSLRETLLRLCAVDPQNRLDARQAVKLMRAFKQQATGDALVPFAEDFVAPVTAKLNALPDLSESLGMKRTCFALEADGRTSVLSRSTDLVASTLTDELPTQEIPASEVRANVMATQEITDGDIPPDGPTECSLDEDTLRPGYALPSTDPPDSLASSWNPGVRSRPLAPGPKQATGSAKRLPPVKPAQGLSKQQTIALGCAIATAAILLVVSIGGVAWMMAGDDAPRTRSEVQTAEKAPSSAALAGSGDHVDISLHAGDPTVQWLRLTNASDERLLTARPDAEGALPAGEYTLSVKVVARPVLKSSIVLDQDTTLTCKPTTMGRVRCTDAAGKTRQLLRP